MWDLLGSTVSVAISFAIPFGAYLRLVDREGAERKLAQFWLAVMVVIGALCCVGLGLNGLS